MMASTPGPATSTDANSQPNAHIFAYLDEYVELAQAPGYAVMLNGAWGIGKSYAVASYIADLRARSKMVAYVSLYGVRTVDEIDTILLIRAFALLDDSGSKSIAKSIASTTARYGISIGKALFKTVSFGADARVADLMPKSKIDLLVFDDFERAGMQPSELLGYINTFVEHDGMRAMIICNENEIKDRDRYRLIREKVIGDTFDLQIDERPALAAFVKSIPDAEARAFLERHADELLALFHQSGKQNLRLLKQTVWGWARLFKYIDKQYRDKENGMLAAFRLFAALSIELKSGKISREDLRGRVDRIVAGEVTGDDGTRTPTPLSAAQRLYPSLPLHDAVLNDDVLEQMLCEGRHDPDAINQSFARSEYFLKSEGTPEWQKVWYGHTMDAAEFGAAFEVMEKQFRERAFVDEGEIIHVMGLRLWCSQIGQLKLSEAEVVAECKAYIDDLLSSGQLSTTSTLDDFAAAYGLGFREAGTPSFNEIVTCYEARTREASERTWPAELAKLLDLMISDTSTFASEVSYTTDDRRNRFADVPIFASCDPESFVDRVLSCHPSQQRKIFTALKYRYQHGGLGSKLAVERDWLGKIRATLLARIAAPGTPPIRRVAVQSVVTSILDPLLS